MSSLPEWANWREGNAWTLGAEEELMLLDPEDWSLAQCAPEVLAALSPELQNHTDGETHRSALELRSDPHPDVPSLAVQLMTLREGLAGRCPTAACAPAREGCTDARRGPTPR